MTDHGASQGWSHRDWQVHVYLHVDNTNLPDIKIDPLVSREEMTSKCPSSVVTTTPLFLQIDWASEETTPAAGPFPFPLLLFLAALWVETVSGEFVEVAVKTLLSGAASGVSVTTFSDVTVSFLGVEHLWTEGKLSNVSPGSGSKLSRGSDTSLISSSELSELLKWFTTLSSPRTASLRAKSALMSSFLLS